MQEMHRIWNTTNKFLLPRVATAAIMAGCHFLAHSASHGTMTAETQADPPRQTLDYSYAL